MPRKVASIVITLHTIRVYIECICTIKPFSYPCLTRSTAQPTHISKIIEPYILFVYRVGWLDEMAGHCQGYPSANMGAAIDLFFHIRPQLTEYNLIILVYDVKDKNEDILSGYAKVALFPFHLWV